MELIAGLSFASPLVLAGLISLPVLWWLLRITPPRPKPLLFPPMRILLTLQKTRESALSSPWWLILLRLLCAALIITALAQPLYSARPVSQASGPLLIIVDNGWASGGHWQDRLSALRGLIEPAIRRNRPIAVMATTSETGEIVIPTLKTGAEALKDALSLKPYPWHNDRTAVLKSLSQATFSERPQIIWLSDGVADEIAANEKSPERSFQSRLRDYGASLTILNPEPIKLPVKLSLNTDQASKVDVISLRVDRTASDSPGNNQIRLLAADGRILTRVPVAFKVGQLTSFTEIRLPNELRNKAVRIDLDQSSTAASVILLDDLWRRRPVGLVEEASRANKVQPLLAPTHYLKRALAPYAEVSKGELEVLLKKPQALLLMADIGTLPATTVERLSTWIRKGGVLVRFAGPRMAAGKQQLTPVRLRVGNRSLGGAMTWSKPARLGPFPQTSPFRGLRLPPDIVVRRQMLAQPSLDLPKKTWATLEDGTPLVTGEARGQGWIVLVHTTANTSWSNLPLSGLFIDMLRRLVVLSQGVDAEGQQKSLPAFRSLDGLGLLRKPYALAESLPQRLPADKSKQLNPGPNLPPGYYGTAESRRAFNLSSQIQAPKAITHQPDSALIRGYELDPELDIKPYLLAAGLIILLLDILISMALRGYLWNSPSRPTVVGSLLFICSLYLFSFNGNHASAQGNDRLAIDALSETRLAYVLTGNDAIDRMTAAGMFGLGRILTLRTAVEPAPAAALDIETDELTFYPFIYWSMSANQTKLSEQAVTKLKKYLSAGGLIVFDTRDAGIFPAGVSGNWQTQNRQRLRELLRRLDLPQLMPVPKGHVLTKTFYLMGSFPGRFDNGKVWVEDPGQSGQTNTNDGVSSVIIGSNDWAAAWAMDENGRNLATLTPGGVRQRELAYRFGVNVILYTLTGNYKADQVHVPAILERLGQ